MPRIKVDLPAEFSFTTVILIRITDLNYGNHVGNDTILSLIHEARVRFLRHHGYGELDLAGTGMIMSDVGIEFKSELFYGDEVIAHVAAGDFTKISFDLYYKLEKKVNDKTIIVAAAKTGMVCFDYSAKKVAAVPEIVKTELTAVK